MTYQQPWVWIQSLAWRFFDELDSVDWQIRQSSMLNPNWHNDFPWKEDAISQFSCRIKKRKPTFVSFCCGRELVVLVIILFRNGTIDRLIDWLILLFVQMVIQKSNQKERFSQKKIKKFFSIKNPTFSFIFNRFIFSCQNCHWFDFEPIKKSFEVHMSTNCISQWHQ